MHLLLLFFSCSYLTSVLADHDIKDYNLKDLLGLWRTLLEYRPDDIKQNDVTFYLYSRNVSNQEIPVDSEDGIDSTKKYKFIIHGYIDNHNRSWYHHMTDAYLKKGDYNIIHVDWWRVARSFYVSSAYNTRLVGGVIAKFILNHKLSPKSVHLIGHSLGAHVSAFAAQTVKNETGIKIHRITGLDPAGPLFPSFFVSGDNRLDENDADIVDAFHTDGLVFGEYGVVGTFDIYINGGTRIQPDCKISLTKVHSAGELFEDVYCSHTRSYVRFIEIIKDKKYKCRKCPSWGKYMASMCETNGFYEFGAEDIDETMTGVCFVNTTNEDFIITNTV